MAYHSPNRNAVKRRSRNAGARGHYAARPGRKSKRRGCLPLPALLIIALALAACAAVFVLHNVAQNATEPEASNSTIVATDSSDATTSESELPTPIMAECDGIELHCAVTASDLTEILIHNASYAYACSLTTQLEEATNTEVMANHGTGRVASEQPTGDEWLTGQFIRCYRSTNAGSKLSAIDCGGQAGTTVYAPVSGTVVLVQEYDLYDKYPDIQIHIQPEGREDLDVVLIHVQNATVQAGDTVIAGVTALAEIRDVYAYIGEEMQLKSYTAKKDNGNHTHIQVNDATDPDYHGLDALNEKEED